MSETKRLVFHDSETDLDVLIEQAHKNPHTLEASDVTVIDGGRAIAGESWGQKLAPYQSWTQGPAKGFESGTDGDLYPVGVLGMGLDEDRFNQLLDQAKGLGGGVELSGGAAVLEKRAQGLAGADLIGVRRDKDGYVVASVDVRGMAEALGVTKDLVIELPAFIDGVPVTRIAAEAFARRHVQGIGVRLLVVPDTVRNIGANAFLALSVGFIHLGAGVEHIGEQRCDLAGTSPRLAGRAYGTSPENPRFFARNGSLFERAASKAPAATAAEAAGHGEAAESASAAENPAAAASEAPADLVFHACPYGEAEVVPPFVRNVRAAAFAEGCQPPSLVRCGAALRRVEAKTWDDAVWICPPKAPASALLSRRGVRLASENAVQVDGCWYDFANDGAALVAGPPKPASVSASFARLAAARAAGVREGDAARATLSPKEAAAKAAYEFAAAGQAGVPVEDTATFVGEVLSLPAAVADKPLVRIGPRALPWAPATVVIPPTVRVIERENTCKSTLHLVLSEGLQEIGQHCFCSRKLQEPVRVPRTVRWIGPGSFEYAQVVLGDGALVAHVSSSQMDSCFWPEPHAGDAAAPSAVSALFNLAAYDDQLLRQSRLPDPMGALLHRLASDVPLDDAIRKTLVRQLQSDALREKAMEAVAREGSRHTVERLLKAGFIDDATFDRQIELLRRANRADCVAFLMEQRHEQPKPTSSRARFAL